MAWIIIKVAKDGQRNGEIDKHAHRVDEGRHHRAAHNGGVEPYPHGHVGQRGAAGVGGFTDAVEMEF